MTDYENFTEQLLEEWVQDKLLDYTAKGYSQEDIKSLGGDFAHHPIPRCLKGTDGVYLFREDHAVHGVLQSEVFQHPCIFGWELPYLENPWQIALYEKWKNKARSLGGTANTILQKEARKRTGSKNVVLMYNHPNSVKVRKQNGFRTGKTNVKAMNLHPNTIENKKKKQKAVRLTCTKTGDVFLFCGVREAARQLNLSHSNISRIAGNPQKVHKGFIAEYVLGPNPFLLMCGKL